MTLFSLAEQIRKCTACPLWKSRTLAVPGDGPSKAKIMFIGEAPGAEEDRTGRSFIGRSGKVLDEMLAVAGLTRENIFVTGSVKCHPAKNRNPTAHELKTCKSLWLDKQIEAINPTLIIILGRVALKSVLNQNALKELHGKVIDKYFITYHPAAAMRFPDIKKRMIDDFQKLKKIMG